MNLALLLKLSLFGVAMGIATVFVLPTQVEPLFWVLIFLFCARMLARKAGGRLFLHGVLLGLANSVWVTAAHIAFLKRYSAFNPQESAWIAITPMHDTPWLAMVLTSPIFGLFFGVLLGSMTLAAARFVRPAATQ